MNLIKPKKLHQGDTIAIIAPSAAVDMERIFCAKKYFEEKGFKVKLGKNIDKSYLCFAGNDNERLEDLHNAFLDNEVDAIVCARGGYGAIRLINKIDYEIIRQNPKIFCGYSDITALGTMFFKRAGLITFSAPMAQPDFADDINKFTEQNFFSTLQGNSVAICPLNPKVYHGGNAQGILLGGNLTTMASVCGMDFIPEDKFIFFAEDLNEPVYKIDRYFTQLLNIDKFHKNLSAILLGDFLDVDNREYLDGCFRELAANLKIPVISGYPITHNSAKAAVPFGAFALLTDGCLTVDNFTV